jgi:hypothetical protein
VAKSTHSGIPWIRFLRRELGDRVHFWPFDGWEIPKRMSVLVEVYPALWNRSFPRETRTPDQHDAYSVARWLREADSNGSLARYFDPPLRAAERKISEAEGWILGVLDEPEKPKRSSRKRQKGERQPATAPPAFHQNGTPLAFSKLDFWRWAFDDLSSNTLRGLVAEYLVAQALEATQEPRQEWDSVDLRTPEGWAVEVKSASYLQSWPQSRPSDIRFAVAPRAGWEAATNRWHHEQRRRADVYVFALLDHKDKATLDPQDLSQWVFWVLPTQRLERGLGGQKSVGLAALERLGAQRADFETLRESVSVSLMSPT